MQLGQRHGATSAGVRLAGVSRHRIWRAWLPGLAPVTSRVDTRPPPPGGHNPVDWRLHLAAALSILMLATSLTVSGAFASGTVIGPSDFIVPCRIQVPLLLKILSFDRALDTTQVDTVRIAVFFSPSTPPGVRERLEGTLAENAGATINGRPFVYTVFVVADRDEARKAIASDPPDAVYLAGVTDDVRAGTLTATREFGVLSFSAMERDVGEGVSVSLSPAGEGSNILINLESLKLEGRRMQAGLLGISQIVRGEQ